MGFAVLLERAAILPIGQALIGCPPRGVEARAKTPVSFLWTASLVGAPAVHDGTCLDTATGDWQERPSAVSHGAVGLGS